MAIDPNAELARYVRRFTTQAEAATAMGITASFLSYLLSGQRNIPDSVLATLGLERVRVDRFIRRRRARVKMD